MIKRNKVFKV